MEDDSVPQDYADSVQYALRARRLIESGAPEALIHAALEVRMGVEARLKEYAATLASQSKKLKRGWRIADIEHALGPAFKTVKKVMQVSMREHSDGDVLFVMRYTPVSVELKKICEKLGNYLHYGARQRWLSEAHWARLAEDVTQGCRHLSLAVSGNLLGPMLMDQHGRADVKLRLNDDGTSPLDVQLIKSRPMIFEVRYIEIADELKSGRYDLESMARVPELTHT